MARFAEYGDYDGLGLAELVRHREVSASEILDEAIARLERLNPRLNAVIETTYDLARGALTTYLLNKSGQPSVNHRRTTER